MDPEAAGNGLMAAGSDSDAGATSRPAGELPKQIGRYEIRGLAGSGAMGRVYIGHDPVVDRRVAVKVCTVDASYGNRTMHLAKRMFVNEARAAGALDHPNILRVYDAGELSGEPYIVMEYVDGGASLEPYCKAGNLLPTETAIDYVRQCAEALDYAHQRGVTHRDIKPANIMLTGDDEVKIVDFGIAQRVQTDHTQILGAMGSPRYMSPEQVHDEDLTGQTDLYSLGVVLYELLTGEPMYSAKSLPGLMQCILSDSPPRLADKRPDLPAALDAVLARVLAKKPQERYQTGCELAEELAGAFAAPAANALPGTDEERFAALRPLQFFKEFTDNQLQDVIQAVAWRSFEPGACVIRESEDSQGFFVLVSGEVHVTKGGARIATICAGECLGEMGYLSGAPRMASAEAVGPLVLLVFDKNVSEWASMAVQMRFQKVFQRTLIERLTRAAEQMARNSG
jgi:eukaryotic-like serine/threonine-protein kinase